MLHEAAAQAGPDRQRQRVRINGHARVRVVCYQQVTAEIGVVRQRRKAGRGCATELSIRRGACWIPPRLLHKLRIPVANARLGVDSDPRPQGVDYGPAGHITDGNGIRVGGTFRGYYTPSNSSQRAKINGIMLRLR